MQNPDLQIERPSTTLRGQLEEKLRQVISPGVFQPGQRFIERELCETLGVGRTSVREALRKLGAEGLITSSPHCGPVVSTMTSDEIEQLYALRALLDAYAGKCCAELATEETKEKLDVAVESSSKQSRTTISSRRWRRRRSSTAFSLRVAATYSCGRLCPPPACAHSNRTLYFNDRAGSSGTHSAWEIREIGAAVRA
jgi:DNA-binding GntR family transcriptional regulator